MTFLPRALSAVARAEKELRNLVSEAAAAGDYGSVVAIASWAKQLTAIAASDASPRVGDTASLSVLGVARDRPSAAARVTGKSYPRFFRDSDRLVRVAWSRAGKAEYTHKAPHQVLTALGAAISVAGAKGRVFSMEEILPLTSHDGAEIPPYQAYVALSLLKQAGLVDQHGRKGYSLTQPDNLGRTLESVWRHLPVMEGEK